MYVITELRNTVRLLFNQVLNIAHQLAAFRTYCILNLSYLTFVSLFINVTTMSKRIDIIDGSKAVSKIYGLIYTCKCGWIDLGHANPEGTEGVKNLLWKPMLSETGKRSRDGKGFKISYSQVMKKFITAGETRHYYVKLGLTKQQKESVALSIFIEVSTEFENMQGSLPYSIATKSGFSSEDLISNLLGFYRTVRPGIDYLLAFQPVSKDAAEKIWDTYGAVENNKNTSFAPFLYPCSECKEKIYGPMCGLLPEILNTIKPAKKGELFRMWDIWSDGL
ncbi:MAG: hypothetical protein JWQ40_1160 [Segetibacter sp.]|nr:hypothetical protein [Segetibacter sp.]